MAVAASRRVSKKVTPQYLPKIYVDPLDNTLFVPPEKMWAVREAAQISRVSRRAKLPERLWWGWVNRFGGDHWIFDWLYRVGKPRRDVRLVYPGDRKGLTREPRSNEFFVEPEMVSFRQEASYTACAKSAGVSSHQVADWLEDFKHIDGFRRWIVHRIDTLGPIEKPFHVATNADVVRCRESWNHVALLAEVGIHLGTYHCWLRETFPRDTLPAWLAWLYGGPEVLQVSWTV